METNPLEQLQDIVAPVNESSDAGAPLVARLSDADAARSKENIKQWTSYLPEDCMKTMIAMGWDVTT